MFSLSKSIVLGMVVWLALITSLPRAQAAPSFVTDQSLHDVPTSSLIYVSDYFSFVGEDGQGRVAFAFDNNGTVEELDFLWKLKS